MSRIIISIIFASCVFSSFGQVNVGIVTGYDMYQRFVNPIDGSGLDRSSGNAFMNTAIGPKLWVGGEKFSVSVEGYANLGYLSFNVEDYFGMGSLAIPVLGKLNFKGASGFTVLEKWGFYAGGGYQWNRTEYFGLSKNAKDKGVVRDWYETYVLEVGIGFGNRSKMVETYIRYGWGVEGSGNALHFGVNTTYSIPYFKKPKFNITPQKDEDSNIFKL